MKPRLIRLLDPIDAAPEKRAAAYRIGAKGGKAARILAALQASDEDLTSLDLAAELDDQVHKVNAFLRHLELAGKCMRVGRRNRFNLWRALA